VAADCRLLHVAALEVDESLLTGESATVAKSVAPLPLETVLAEQVNMLSMGTVAVRGRGRAVVVATGGATQLGKIARRVEELGHADVPLLRRMASFARILSLVVLGGAALGFAGGLAAGESPDELFLTLVALAVSAIPEGLPIVLTVTLAIGLNRMARRKVIVRRLAAVETLGSCSVIGSDKTGTLTQNQMTVRAIYCDGATFEVSGSGYGVEGAFYQDGAPAEVAPESPLFWTLLAGTLCNDASLALQEDGSISTAGDPTEIALLVSAAKAGIWKADVEDTFERWSEIPFDPERRYAATLNRTAGRSYLFVKGAPERVLDLCDVPAADEGPSGEAVLSAADDMARQGLRVLALACEETNRSPSPSDFESKHYLKFLGLQGMLDPPRTEAPAAIAACQSAGIRVLMITGDHASTGLAIAAQLGIADPDEDVLTGADLDGLSQSELLDAVKRVSVFARVSPEHKLRIVHALQANGEVVAVTGDGVNDGPALRAANVGVAMGLSGTDVAKEAADVVATDDNFASIVAGVEEGRVVFDNVRLATFFLISSGVGEVIAVLASIFFAFELPFLPVQLLWLNLVTNGVQDVALAFEPGEKDVMRKRPRPVSEGIISRLLWERTLITGAVLAAGTLLLFLLEIQADSSIDRARTVALTTMVLFQVLHVGNCRSETRSAFAKSPLLNPFLFVGAVAALTLHVGALHFGPAQGVLHLEPLDLETWAKMGAVALSVTVVNELHKLVRRRLAM
jgi:Ca2+-transporting ATPase